MLDSFFPDPFKTQTDFRNTEKYNDCLKEAAQHFTNWAITRIVREKTLDVAKLPLGGMEKLGFLRVVEYASQRSFPNGEKDRLHSARYCSPGYFKGWQENKLKRFNDYLPLSVTGEHPFTKAQSKSNAFQIILDRVGPAPTLQKLLATEEELLEKIKIVLDESSTTVLTLRKDEYKTIAKMSNPLAWLTTKTRDGKALSGWYRYANCPDSGLWDRQTGMWTKPWEKSEQSL